jgi:predicted heme/steroid binding protein
MNGGGRDMSRTFTKADLKEFNGKKGKAAYVGFKGKVYDVSKGATWDEGDHFSLHEAGISYSDDMDDAPHGDEVFADMPVVGELSD